MPLVKGPYTSKDYWNLPEGKPKPQRVLINPLGFSSNKNFQ